jgi:SAM-dependent methyltransferase
MAQRTSNIYRLVTIPAVYKTIQKVLGAEQSSRRFVDEVVRPTRGAAVLDVGCGPASLLPYLPSIDYTGVDLNPASIAFAKKNYAERGRFLVGDAADLVPDQRYDIVIVAAILHHLDDAGAKRLFGNLVGALKPGGRIVTIDNIWLPRQNPIAKLINALDSGKNVRTLAGYQKLAEGLPLRVEHKLYRDLLRIPYDHVCLTLTVAQTQ